MPVQMIMSTFPVLFDIGIQPCKRVVGRVHPACHLRWDSGWRDMLGFAQSHPIFRYIRVYQAIVRKGLLAPRQCFIPHGSQFSCDAASGTLERVCGAAGRGSVLMPMSVVPENNPGYGSNAAASHTMLAGGADTLRGGKGCTMACEFELATPCRKTVPNSLIALPVRA